MDNSIIEVEQEIVVEESREVVYGEVLDYKKKKFRVDVKGIANKLMQVVDFSEVLKEISVDKEYVLCIPEEFREGLENGQYWIMESAKENGKFWPNIMEKAESGKNQIVKPLGLKEKISVQDNPLHELSDKCQNAYLQAQMQHVAELLEEAVETIKLVEQGLESDRIGLLTSGKELLYLAASQKDEASRTLAMQNALQNISTAKGQFYDVFKKRAEAFPMIPESKVLQFLKVMASPKTDYLTKNTREYKNLQKCFECFSEATKLMATTYLLMGDEDNAKRVYEGAVLEVAKIDTTALSTAQFLPKVDGGICEDPVEILESEGQLCLEQKNKKEQLTIEISGKALLEAAEME